MKGGRKNLKREAQKNWQGRELELEAGQSIAKVVSLRGSNVIEVVDASATVSLALFPAKFQKRFWIRRGSFVVVDEHAKHQALQSGHKIASIVARVLFPHQLSLLQNSSLWPEIFKTSVAHDSSSKTEKSMPDVEEELNLSDEDGLPPLEANTNRIRPTELYSDPESDSCPDLDSDS